MKKSISLLTALTLFVGTIAISYPPVYAQDNIIKNKSFTTYSNDGNISRYDLPEDSEFVYQCYLTHSQVQDLLEEKRDRGNLLRLLKMALFDNAYSLGLVGVLAAAMIRADIYNLEKADKGNGVYIYTLNHRPSIVWYQTR